MDKFSSIQSQQINGVLHSSSVGTADKEKETHHCESELQLVLIYTRLKRDELIQENAVSPVTLGRMQSEAYQGAPAVTMESYLFRAM